MTRKPKGSKRDDRMSAQVLAADPSQPVWVSANAGTGKTHVLITRILRLLLAGTPPPKILTLTFTKAAAAEVVSRLTDRLSDWAAMADDRLDADLLELLGKPAQAEERRRARRLFAETLEAPEGIRVRTIHSFCESLLGRFPIEAKVTPHFSVIDDRRAAEIRGEAETRVIVGAAGGRTKIGKALAQLAGLVDADRFASLIATLDKQRGKVREQVNAAGGLDAMIARLRHGLGLGPTDTRATLISAAARDGAFEKAALSRAARALDQGSDGDRARGMQIRDWIDLEAARRAEAFIDVYAPIFVKQDWHPKVEKSLITKKAKAADPDAAGVLLDEQTRVAAVLDKLKSATLAEGTAALLTIGWAMIDGYDEVKRTRALLDYDDLIGKAAALLEADDGVSWVHYKLDGGIDHILVDEAQDTSPGQWRVVTRLAEEFFSGVGAGDDERPGPRTVFAVGDEKQSIFSFQGADPTVFGQTRAHFAGKFADAGRRLQDAELVRSYRSSAAVLKVVDEVFENPAAGDGLSFHGRPIVHHTERVGQAGRVELWPTLTPEDVPVARPWDWPLDRPSPLSPEVRLAGKIAATIRGWLDAKELLESAGRPIAAGDVMILVRTRGRFADEMVKALERRGVDVAGRDRLKLLDHIAVMDLVAAGRFALLPEDDLNTATVLKGPFIGLDDDDLIALAHKRPGTLWRELKKRRGERPGWTAAEVRLDGLLADADSIPPYEFFFRLLGPGHGRRLLQARLGPEVLEPLDAFLALALEFERDHEPSLEAFLHWLGESEAEVKREMEQARTAVRVLTVHGAKGLESEIVFLADTCTLPNTGKDDPILWRTSPEGAFPVWRMTQHDEDSTTRSLHQAQRSEILREHRRLLYVAMTRARERLYVCGWQGKNKLPEGCWYDLAAPVIRSLGKHVDLADGGTVVRYETPQQAAPDRPAELTASRTAAAAPPAWARTDPAPEPKPARPLTPSRPDDEPAVSSPLGRDDGKRFKRGLIVHRLLQSLPGLPSDKRETAARAFVARPALALAEGAQNEIVAETLAVLDHSDFAHLFRPGSLAEVPIVGVVGDSENARAISGQIDRLVVADDAITVIDFKTNRPPPESENDVATAYLRQMAAYRWAVRKIYPGRTVAAVLLWTAGPRLMPLSPEILDAHAP